MLSAVPSRVLAALQADSDKSVNGSGTIVPYCLYAFQIRNDLKRDMEPNSLRRHVYQVHQWKYCERETWRIKSKIQGA